MIRSIVTSVAPHARDRTSNSMACTLSSYIKEPSSSDTLSNSCSCRQSGLWLGQEYILWCSNFVPSTACNHNQHAVFLNFSQSPFPMISACLTPLPKCGIYESVNRFSIGSDISLTLIRRQAIIWTNAGLLSMGSLGTNSSEILIKMKKCAFTKMHL